MWDDEPAGGGDGQAGLDAGGPRTPKGKAALVLVVTLAMLATLVLCCVAIDQAARLINVDPSRL